MVQTPNSGGNKFYDHSIVSNLLQKINEKKVENKQIKNIKKFYYKKIKKLFLIYLKKLKSSNLTACTVFNNLWSRSLSRYSTVTYSCTHNYVCRKSSQFS